MIDSIKLWLRQAWIWIVGIGAAVFILWLRFYHDPQVARKAQLEHRRKETLKRLEAYEKSAKDTKEEEERLVMEIEGIDKELKEIHTEHTSADDAATDIGDWLNERTGEN